MIIDSHTHAWKCWPYEPKVPDVESRGRVEQLLWEMDRCHVDRAVLVSARVEYNSDNNEYGAECAARYPDRLSHFADVDCMWSSTYHTPGAAERLRAAVERYSIVGFTHYVDDDTDWFESEEGLRFFAVAAEHNLLVSLALPPKWQPALRQLARHYPSVPLLCHHMGLVRVGEDENLRQILASAQMPNIYIKLSGQYYASRVGWDFPNADTQPIVRALYNAYGPTRLLWGSDYPVVRSAMTYEQALEVFRTHCTFVSEADKTLILGENLNRLLAHAGR